MNNAVPMPFNEPKAMTMQIGLQCVNQSNSLNINSPTDVGISNYTNSGLAGDCQQSSCIYKFFLNISFSLI